MLTADGTTRTHTVTNTFLATTVGRQQTKEKTLKIKITLLKISQILNKTICIYLDHLYGYFCMVVNGE